MTRRRCASSCRATSTVPAADRALRRDGREVHRRRGDGGVGDADRHRGRRRAGGAGGARPGRGRHGARRRGRRADLRLRAGVLTGEATVTVGADGQGMVAGDLVNTACADPVAGGAREGARGRDDTGATTEPTIVYEDAGTHESRARQDRIRSGGQCGSSSGARGALKSEGLEAPFVGRDRELRQIKELFHASAEERRAHLISVTGSPGSASRDSSGSSTSTSTAWPKIVYWHRGRCLSYGEGVTYWALADMVRMRCRISEDESQPARRSRSSPWCSDEHVDRPRGARVRRAPGRTPDRPREEPAPEPQGSVRGLATFLRAARRRLPEVLVFEDMQWADASLLDFIEYLLEWSRQ